MIITNTITAEEFLQSLNQNNTISDSAPIYCEFKHSPAVKLKGMWTGEPLNGCNYPETAKRKNRYVTVSAFYGGRRTKANFACLLAVMLDDIGPKVPGFAIDLEPTYKVETSSDNFQYWYLLETPISDFNEADELIQAIVNRLRGLTNDGSDPGSAGLTRYGRIPGSINNKYDAPWAVKCTGNSALRFTKNDLIKGLKLSFKGIKSSKKPLLSSKIDVLDQITAWSDPVLQLIEAAGGVVNDRGEVVDVLCPWIDEHSNAPETGAAILVRPGGGIGFQCHHGHCQDRTLADVNQKLKEDGYMGWKTYRGQPMDEVAALKAEIEELKKRPAPPPITENKKERGKAATLTERYTQLYQSGLSEAEIQEITPALAEEYGTDHVTARRVAESVRAEQAQADRIDDAQGELDAAIAAAAATVDLADYLPEDLYEVLNHLQTSLNYAPEVVLTAFLTAFSGIQATGMEIDIYQAETNFKQPLTIYAAMVAASGQKKTPLFSNLITLPLAPINKEMKRDHQYRRDIWELEKVENKNAAPPKKPTLVISAATVEGLLKRIEGQPDKGILFFRDELAATFKSLNTYKSKGGDDEEVLIELYDGGAFETARVDESREVDIERSHLSIYGGIQDAVFRKMLSEGDSNGKFARFWFAHQPERPSYLGEGQGDIQRNQYLLAQLTRYYRWAREARPVSYKLTDEAYETFKAAYNRYEQIKVEERDLLKPIWGKSAGRVARCAALLFQLHSIAAKDFGDTIGPRYIELAVLLEDVLTAKSRQLYLSASKDYSQTAKHQWAFERLQERGSVDARYLSRASHKRSDKSLWISANEAKQIMRSLAETDYGRLEGKDLIANVELSNLYSKGYKI